MDEMGGMLILNITEPVMEVFEVTGLFGYLVIMNNQNGFPKICIRLRFWEEFFIFFYHYNIPYPSNQNHKIIFRIFHK